jgi:hypothetical protein
MTYAIVVSVPIENMTYIHTSPLIPQVASVCLMLHGQHCIRYENVFTSYGRGPRDIPRSPCPRCAVMASHIVDNAVHISRYRLSSSKPRLEGTGPEFTSPSEMISYVPMETYSLLLLIDVQDTLGPCLALGEPPMFHRSWLLNLPSYLVVGASLHNSKF